MKSLKSLGFKSNKPVWTQETFEKHGTGLIRNFIRVQRNWKRKNSARMTKFWARLFRRQINLLIAYVEGHTKGYYANHRKSVFDMMHGDSGAAWDVGLEAVFNQDTETFTALGNNGEIQKAISQGVYRETSKLLGNEVTKRGQYELDYRNNQLASKVTRVNQTTRKVLKDTITKSLENGDSVASTIKKVRETLPRMNRRIPTIVRTEMGRAADEGVKQSMKESETVTHCSVMGCEKEEPLFTYRGDSTCNVRDVPIADVDSIEFHINHTGAWFPSKFKTTADIIKEAGITEREKLKEDPAAFPSRPLKDSIDSQDMHTRQGGLAVGGGLFYNNTRMALHNDIKNKILNDPKADQPTKRITVFGGDVDTHNNPQNYQVRGELVDGVRVNGSQIQRELPEFQQLQYTEDGFLNPKANAFTHKEAMDITDDLIQTGIAQDKSMVIQTTGNGSYKELTRKLTKYGENGHEVNGKYVLTDIDDHIASQKARIAQERNMGGKSEFTPEEVIRRTRESHAENLMRAVEGSYFDNFDLYDDGVLIFKYTRIKGKPLPIIVDQEKYKNFLLSSPKNKKLWEDGKNLPFLKNPKNATPQKPNVKPTPAGEKPNVRDKWVEAKSITEAEKWAQDHICIYADYSKVSLDTANLMNQTIAEELGNTGLRFRNIHAGRSKGAHASVGHNLPNRKNPARLGDGYNEMKDRIVGADFNMGIESMKDRVTMEVQMNRMYGQNSGIRRNPNTDLPNFNNKTTSKGVIQHEVAHFKDAITQFKRGGGNQYSDTFPTMWNNSKLTPTEKRLFFQELTDRIGKYHKFGNERGEYGEMIAELQAVRRMGHLKAMSKNHPNAVRQIEEWLDGFEDEFQTIAKNLKMENDIPLNLHQRMYKEWYGRKSPMNHVMPMEMGDIGGQGWRGHSGTWRVSNVDNALKDGWRTKGMPKIGYEPPARTTTRPTAPLDPRKARTIKEAEDFAKSLNNVGDVDYGSLSLTEARRINEQLANMQELGILKGDNKFSVVGTKVSKDGVGGGFTMLKYGSGGSRLRIAGDYDNILEDAIKKETRSLGQQKRKLNKELKEVREQKRKLAEWQKDPATASSPETYKYELDQLNARDRGIRNLLDGDLFDPKAIRKRVESKRNTLAQNLDDAVVHEYGHILQADLQVNANLHSPKVRSILQRIKNNQGYRTDSDNLLFDKDTNLFDKLAQSDTSVSHYANTNGAEYFAESWLKFHKTGRVDNHYLQELFTELKNPSA